jgi:hypothetical protein
VTRTANVHVFIGWGIRKLAAVLSLDMGFVLMMVLLKLPSPKSSYANCMAPVSSISTDIFCNGSHTRRRADEVTAPIALAGFIIMRKKRIPDFSPKILSF